MNRRKYYLFSRVSALWNLEELCSIKIFSFSSMLGECVLNNDVSFSSLSLVFKRAVILVYKENCKLKKKLVRHE